MHRDDCSRDHVRLDADRAVGSAAVRDLVAEFNAGWQNAPPVPCVFQAVFNDLTSPPRGLSGMGTGRRVSPCRRSSRLGDGERANLAASRTQRGTCPTTRRCCATKVASGRTTPPSGPEPYAWPLAWPAGDRRTRLRGSAPSLQPAVARLRRATKACRVARRGIALRGRTRRVDARATAVRVARHDMHRYVRSVRQMVGAAAALAAGAGKRTGTRLCGAQRGRCARKDIPSWLCPLGRVAARSMLCSAYASTLALPLHEQAGPQAGWALAGTARRLKLPATLAWVSVGDLSGLLSCRSGPLHCAGHARGPRRARSAAGAGRAAETLTRSRGETTP